MECQRNEVAFCVAKRRAQTLKYINCTQDFRTCYNEIRWILLATCIQFAGARGRAYRSNWRGDRYTYLCASLPWTRVLQEGCRTRDRYGRFMSKACLRIIMTLRPQFLDSAKYTVFFFYIAKPFQNTN